MVIGLCHLPLPGLDLPSANAVSPPRASYLEAYSYKPVARNTQQAMKKSSSGVSSLKDPERSQHGHEGEGLLQVHRPLRSARLPQPMVQRKGRKCQRLSSALAFFGPALRVLDSAA